MKTVLALVFALSTTATLAGSLQKGSAQVSVDVEYALLGATVACVTKYHPNSEGEEFPEIYFVNGNEYGQYSKLLKEGYSISKTLKEGHTCYRDNMNMKHVAVGLFDKAAKITAAIRNAKAAVKGTVILVKNDQFKKAAQAEKTAVIQSLLD